MNSLDFLDSVWEPQGEGFAFLSLRSDDLSWRDLAYKLPTERDKIELPDVALGDIYFCPNLFKRPRRRKGLMLPTPWLYADLDKVHPEDEQVFMRPSVAWESSPGRYQCMWICDVDMSEEVHMQLNQKMTYKIGADKGGWDVTQVLRVPGTINHKYTEKPEVKLLWTDVLRSQM